MKTPAKTPVLVSAESAQLQTLSATLSEPPAMSKEANNPAIMVSCAAPTRSTDCPRHFAARQLHTIVSHTNLELPPSRSRSPWNRARLSARSRA
jgi:hypothetical protein